jgi:hypothetical protein
MFRAAFLVPSALNAKNFRHGTKHVDRRLPPLVAEPFAQRGLAGRA